MEVQAVVVQGRPCPSEALDVNPAEPHSQIQNLSQEGSSEHMNLSESCNNDEWQEAPAQGPAAEESAAEAGSEYLEEIQEKDPFTEVVNASIDKCLNSKDCCFDLPHGEGLAGCCMRCGMSKARSRCSRCRQVPSPAQPMPQHGAACLQHCRQRWRTIAAGCRHAIAGEAVKRRIGTHISASVSLPDPETFTTLMRYPCSFAGKFRVKRMQFCS